MQRQNIKYEPVTANDIATVNWMEREYQGTPIYIGLINDFIMVVCAQSNGIEYDSIAIRFRIRNYEIDKADKSEKVKSRGIISVYRHEYILSDLKEGLWLSNAEIIKINGAVEKLIDEMKINFAKIK
jgi:hypothetical protein